MIPVVVCILIGGLWATIAGYDDPIVDAVCGAFAGLLVGFIISCAVGFVAYHDTEWKVQSMTNLVSLADGSGVEGHFFLGSGSIDTEPSFTWYEANGVNSFVRKDVDASESTVHYLPAGEMRPYYTRSTQENTSPGFIQTWGFSTGGGEIHYDFYVPRGSIMQTYRLDNQ